MGHNLIRKVNGSPDETRPFKDGKGKMDFAKYAKKG
jgi:hypothetical protein